MLPLALDEPAKGSEFGLYTAGYRITRGHLLLALLSAAVLALIDDYYKVQSNWMM
jgi:hypothetical protein